MRNTKIMCAVMLDTKVCAFPLLQLSYPRLLSRLGSRANGCSVQGPEIRTGFLENAKPIQLTAGKEVTLTTDYDKKGNSGLIAVR